VRARHNVIAKKMSAQHQDIVWPYASAAQLIL